MLARIAYQLYWIGRHVARAEHTARMLDGVFQANLQARAAPSRQPLSWEAVMAVMGAESHEDGPIAAGEAVRALTLDSESPASVTACIERARDGARMVRDVVSAEMWEALNTLYLELDSSDLGAALRTGPYSVYAFVRQRCALWWGLADETMLRDPGYAFLSAGRHSEAAEMILRMLRVSLGTPESADDAAGSDRALALLQAVGGLEAYRRSVASPVAPAPVTEFLTFESGYPHSIAASLESLQECLAEVGGSGRDTAPVLRLARLRAELEFHRGLGSETSPLATPGATEAGITALLEHIQQELAVLDAEVERRYFTGEAPQRQVVTS
jgi:uncharacterized alpha-E superfamily protein